MGFADANTSRAMHTALRLCEIDLRIDTAVTMDPGLEKIVAFLNRESIRAIYGAVGEVLGVSGRSVGAMLWPRRPEVSWVVNTKIGEPTGYQPHERHPKLLNSKLLTTGIELLRMMAGIRPHPGAR